MRLKKRCHYCPDLFTPDSRSYRTSPSGKGRWSAQMACGKPLCQRRRHREACRRWHLDNPTYDDGQRPGPRSRAAYMRGYRKSHPAYVASNLEKQRKRDGGRKNLVTRDAIALFCVEKVRRLINLVTRDAIRTPPVRVSEEICRQLERANRLVTRDTMVLQRRMAQNGGHETPPHA